jgi:hypothetical protein
MYLFSWAWILSGFLWVTCGFFTIMFLFLLLEVMDGNKRVTIEGGFFIFFLLFSIGGPYVILAILGFFIGTVIGAGIGIGFEKLSDKIESVLCIDRFLRFINPFPIELNFSKKKTKNEEE